MMHLDSHKNPIAFAFASVGGLGAAAKICGRSYQAVNKWRLTAKLPRTEYTGETQYAKRLEDAARKNGIHFEASWLLDQCKRIDR